MNRIRIKSLDRELNKKNEPMVRGGRSSSACTRTRAEHWHKLLLRPDIDGLLAFSKLRCVISIISIALLATDIPRSGLGVGRLGDYYQTAVMPDTVARFGPYDYPVRHIWRKSGQVSGIDGFYGREGEDPVESANAWSYQYDTTSVGLRGAVELLNVTGFPESLLYKGEWGKKSNQSGILSLNATFLMLDAFISTARAGLLRDEAPSVLRFATKHKWVDRVYQYLTRFVKPHGVWSLHTLHVMPPPRHVNAFRPCAATESLRPRFCSYPGIWKCTHPVNASLPAVWLADQMDIRYKELQRRYPDLALDVALISTHRPSVTSGTLSFTFFNCEDQEIVMLTRGRRCTGNDTLVGSSECTTVFVDDYRYEREILETNVVDWHFFIAMMRAGAQGYFWVRLGLLYRGAYIAAEKVDQVEESLGCSRGVSAALSVFKIPFQVVVYSSLLPVVGYVLALLLDGNFMDIYLDSYWSTLEGVMSIKLLPFLNLAVTQMRSVWLMALLVDVVVLVARKPINGSEEKLPGIRGLAISFTSALAIIGPYRHPAFRSTEIVSAIRLPIVGQRMDSVLTVPHRYFNASTYLLDDSTTMLVLCVGAVAVLASTARLVGFIMREDQEVVLMSTLGVPIGTEILWPTSSLSVRFNALTSSTPYQLHADLQHRAKISPEPKPVPASALRPLPLLNMHSTTRRLSEWRLWSPHRRKRTSPPAHNFLLLPTGGLASRTPNSHSVQQLMNIAMMTDPWNLFWLRVLGVNLYLYRIRPAPLSCSSLDSCIALLPYAVILPYSEDEMEERTGLGCDDFQLVDSLSSRDLPMSTLLQSG